MTDRLVINLAHSKYQIIEQIAKKDFGWKVTKKPDAPFDIFWADTVSPPMTVVLLHRTGQVFGDIPKDEPLPRDVPNPQKEQSSQKSK